jgi:hypothetical protein
MSTARFRLHFPCQTNSYTVHFLADVWRHALSARSVCRTALDARVDRAERGSLALELCERSAPMDGKHTELTA